MGQQPTHRHLRPLTRSVVDDQRATMSLADTGRHGADVWGHANYRPPPSTTVQYRPLPSTAVQYRVVMVKYCYIAIDVILYIVTNPACHQRNKSGYMDRLVGWLVSYVNNVAP